MKEEGDQSNINEEEELDSNSSIDDRGGEEKEDFDSNSGEEDDSGDDNDDDDEDDDEDGGEVVETDDENGDDDDEEEEDSGSESDESDSEDDESSDDGDEGDEDVPNDGLSQYERLRLERIARNQARLSSLGLHKISNEMAKSKEQKKKQQQQKRNRQPTLDGPRRQLPGRSARATSFFITEQSEHIKSTAAAAASSASPKQKKVKKNVDACWECQEDTGELHVCDYCRRLYHRRCDGNLNKNDDAAASEEDFKCTMCEKEGKNRRVPCGRCEGCTRDWDCETCVFCRRKMTADDEASVRQKCIFRKCRNWGKRATVIIGNDDGSDDGDEESDDGHDAECNECNVGGDLICCDGCPRVFHSDCHKPKIHTLPDGEWFCMHCSKKPKPPKEKKSKYAGPLLADLGNREVSCLVHFPKLECLVCEGMEVTGPRKELDWVTCKICDDAFHLQCLDPPLANRPNSFRCLSCKESKRKCIIPKEKKTKPLYGGIHDDDCFICRNGGNLVCCDFCEKAFHLECHIPPLPGVPTTATWKCCECAALEYKRKFRCGECKACKVKDDCGKCHSCLDKPKFGGAGVHKQRCALRRCPYMRFAPPANANESKSKRKHFLIHGDDEGPLKKHKKHKKSKKLKKLKSKEERLMEISALGSNEIKDVDCDAYINRKKIKGDPVGNKIRLIIKKAFEKNGDAEVQETALDHLRFITKTAENADRAIKLGAVKMTRKAMNDHPEKSKVQSEANAFLAELVWVYPPCIATILREGCIPLVLKSIDFHDRNIQVCTSAISVFRAISYDFSNHWIVNNFKATASVIETMKVNQESNEVLGEGALFLQNIVCNHEILPDAIDLILSKGIIPIVAHAMSLSSADTKFLECACELLGNLAFDYNISNEIGSHSSSIEVLLGILTTNSGVVSTSALIALKHISTDNGDNAVRIVEQDGIRVVLSFLEGKNSDIDLITTGLGLLCHLTRNRSSNNSDLLFDFVINVMRNHFGLPRMQAGACSVIRNLVLVGIEQAKVAKDLILSAIDRYENDNMVQLEGCQAMLNLCTQFPSIVEPLRQQESYYSSDSPSPKRKRRKVEKISENEHGADEATDQSLEKANARIVPEPKHALRPLKKALTNDPIGNQIRLLIITALRNLDDYKLQAAVCEHLRYLVTSIKNCSTIVKLGGLKMIHISMNQHPRKTKFQNEAITLLLDLIAVNPSVITSICTEGLFDLLIESMYSNGHNFKVQQPCIGIFRVISYDFGKHSDIQNVKGIEAIIESMKRNPKKCSILKEGCTFLQNFLCNEEKRGETIELISSLNVLPVVVDSMYSSSDDMDFLGTASGLLANLAMDDPSIVSDYVLSIKTLLVVLQMENILVETSVSVFTALRLLLTNNVENRRKVSEGGGIKIITDFLAVPREVIVVESGLELLVEMIKNSSEISEQLQRCGGIQFVLSLIRGKPRSSTVQAAGCRILRALVTLPSHSIELEMAKETVKAILSMMKSHRNNSRVQLESSRALLQICTLSPSLTESFDILSHSSIRDGIFSK